MRDQSHSLFRLWFGLAENDKVVCIPDMPETGLFELPIQVIENDVGQQRRNNASLRRAHGCGFEDTGFHHPRRKKSLDKPENIAVGHVGGHCLHNDRVRKIVEEAFDVGIQDMLIAFLMETEGLFDRLMAVASLAEAEGRVMKERFKDRIEEAANHFLCNPVFDGWNAERPNFRLILRNEDAAERAGLKCALFEFPHQRHKVFIAVVLKHLDANLIDPSGATIALDSLKAVQQQSEGDASG